MVASRVLKVMLALVLTVTSVLGSVSPFHASHKDISNSLPAPQGIRAPRTWEELERPGSAYMKLPADWRAGMMDLLQGPRNARKPKANISRVNIAALWYAALMIDPARPPVDRLNLVRLIDPRHQEPQPQPEGLAWLKLLFDLPEDQDAKSRALKIITNVNLPLHKRHDDTYHHHHTAEKYRGVDFNKFRGTRYRVNEDNPKPIRAFLSAPLSAVDSRLKFKGRDDLMRSDSLASAEVDNGGGLLIEHFVRGLARTYSDGPNRRWDQRTRFHNDKHGLPVRGPHQFKSFDGHESPPHWNPGEKLWDHRFTEDGHVYTPPLLEGNEYKPEHLQ